ncbi:hypothetical protein Tco_0753671 [Tanacetum coccineum]
MIENKKLDEDLQGKLVDAIIYRGMIGSLMYLTSNRPDLNYVDTDMSLIAYADADNEGCQDTRRSTLGSAQFLGDKLVSWSSKKQKSTAILSTKTEYIALSRSKHIDIRAYHFKRSKWRRLSSWSYSFLSRTEYQLADIFTKLLPREDLTS